MSLLEAHSPEVIFAQLKVRFWRLEYGRDNKCPANIAMLKMAMAQLRCLKATFRL